MATHSTSSQQPSLLELFRLAEESFPDLAADSARLASSSLQVPGLEIVVEPLKKIHAWTRQLREHREIECGLSHGAVRLVLLISKFFQDENADRGKLQAAVERIVTTIREIEKDAQEWMNILAGTSAFAQLGIEEKIPKHEELLKGCSEHLSSVVTLREATQQHFNISSQWNQGDPPTTQISTSFSGALGSSMLFEDPGATLRVTEQPNIDPPPAPSAALQGEDIMLGITDSSHSQPPGNPGPGYSGATDLPGWTTFLTVHPEQHARFRKKPGSRRLCGGFSDVWECDAKFSNGEIVSTAFKELRPVRIDNNADEHTIKTKLLEVRPDRPVGRPCLQLEVS